ncbi:hypothetical protein B0H17DRAFT_663904 [Mycena rosella]|uniref:Uncharacterized protein n=1 Tax=Mycena rosella TaxID=1033263 RepID=A0AAD7GU19_MYCRO|nr:hypothetical protein B0H17DRAFT_663904 [Mycena rosella]
MSRRGPHTPTFAGEISTCGGTYTRIDSDTKTRFFFYNTGSPEQAEEHARRLMDSANGTVYGGEVTTAGHIHRERSETSTEYHLGEGPLHANNPTSTAYDNAQYRDHDYRYRGSDRNGGSYAPRNPGSADYPNSANRNGNHRNASNPDRAQNRGYQPYNRSARSVSQDANMLGARTHNNGKISMSACRTCLDEI